MTGSLKNLNGLSVNALYLICKKRGFLFSLYLIIRFVTDPISDIFKIQILKWFYLLIER